MALEKSITKSIIDYINSLPGGRAEKVMGGASSSGRADINACYKGRMIRIETKTPDHRNVASKKQSHNLEKWYKAGSAVIIAYSLNAVKIGINCIDKGIEGGRLSVPEENGCISEIFVPKKGCIA